ncbi:MAG TPA: hypothetical protein VML91_10550 [Burkholderiales bacterium]|nr:hypothetical protein [Burkholderiales bacterium]
MANTSDRAVIRRGVIKAGGKLVGVDQDPIRRCAVALRDYVVEKLGWTLSVVETNASSVALA